MGIDVSQVDSLWVQLFAFAVKFAVILVVCLHVAPIMVWLERRAPALMQRRKGPNRVGLFRWRLFGLFQPLADVIKLVFKEEVVPEGSHKIFYHLAPVFSLFPALLIACAIPYGPTFTWDGHQIALSIISVDVGFLFIFAISSIGVYGVAIAGWACNNKYSLLGSLRAAAQMVSYEIPLGLALIPIVVIYGTLDLNEIVIKQESVWGVFLAPVSFVIFLICMFAETNRAPFDLAEGESELVAGFHTEYNSFKFSQFFLAEYTAMFVLSCLASTVFFGGWRAPFLSQELLLSILGSEFLVALFGFVVLLMKAAFFMWIYVWARWTLPRFRYDQLMGVGWKFMMPVALVNVVVYAAVVAALRF